MPGSGPGFWRCTAACGSHAALHDRHDIIPSTLPAWPMERPSCFVTETWQLRIAFCSSPRIAGRLLLLLPPLLHPRPIRRRKLHHCLSCNVFADADISEHLYGSEIYSVAFGQGSSDTRWYAERATSRGDTAAWGSCLAQRVGVLARRIMASSRAASSL